MEQSPFMRSCLEFIQTQPFSIIRLSQVYRDDPIETAECTRANFCQNTYSVAKMFTAAAIGLLIDAGKLRLDERVCDILREEIPEKGMDPRWEDATVERALTHKLGLPVGFLDIDTHSSAGFTQDFLRYMLTYPLPHEPGVEAHYSDGAFYLLARIAEKKAGMGLDDFLWQKLLWKMGFQEMAWSHCPMGHTMGATGLYLHASDMVKLGQLYLNGGVYRGERLLSWEWVDKAVSSGFAVDWDDQHRIYYKGGMHGQKLIVAPEQGRVVAMQACGANSQVVAEWIRDYGARE